MMNPPQIREVIFAPSLLGNPMMNGKFLAIFQMLVADWADTLLPLNKLSATKRCHLRLSSSLLPVVLQPDGETFMLNVAKETLESAPGFDKSNWPQQPAPMLSAAAGKTAK
jgi:hypothetical protein